MSAPFTGDIIGSWLFTRSSQPTFTPRIIYHFTMEGKGYREMDHEERRVISAVKYRFAGNTLTLIYFSGNERDYALTEEDDHSVLVPSPNGILWWMIRLAKPESYSKAFVNEHGHLQKLECA